MSADATTSELPPQRSVLRWRVLLIAVLSGTVAFLLVFWLLSESIGQMIEGCGPNTILVGRPGQGIPIPLTTPLRDKFGRQTQVVNYTFYADRPFEFTLIQNRQQGAVTPARILSRPQSLGYANKLEMQLLQVGDELSVTNVHTGKSVAAITLPNCARLEYYQGQRAAGTKHVSGTPWELFQPPSTCNGDIRACCTILP